MWYYSIIIRFVAKILSEDLEGIVVPEGTYKDLQSHIRKFFEKGGSDVLSKNSKTYYKILSYRLSNHLRSIDMSVLEQCLYNAKPTDGSIILSYHSTSDHIRNVMHNIIQYDIFPYTTENEKTQLERVILWIIVREFYLKFCKRRGIY